MVLVTSRANRVLNCKNLKEAGISCLFFSIFITMAKLKINYDECIQRFKAAHGDKYDYSKVIYTGPRNKVTIICPEHGEFNQAPYVHWNGSHCRKCANANISKNKKMSLDKCLSKFKDVHGDKYDYSRVRITYGKSDKVEIICPIHGSFWINDNLHRKGSGCPECAKLNKQKLPFCLEKCLSKFKDIHGDKYDYSKVEYTKAQNHVNIICPEHGEFKQQPYNHWNGHGCPSCGSLTEISTSEQQIFEFINSLVPCEQSNRNIISPYELDIFIPSMLIAVELNGNYWHSSKHKDKLYHLFKTELSNKMQNVRVIHIFEDEWLNQQQIVKSRIKSILGKTSYKIYARKCEVREITTPLKTKFLNKYHIQGACASSINLGLFYHNRLVAVMTFGKRRFDKKEGYELIRYCTIGNFNIVGGAGKLLKHFEREWSPTTIISYADRRWSIGNLYKQLGFIEVRKTTPNYYYVHPSTGYLRESRIKYQKHKLFNMLDSFDPNKTEWENMQDHGYSKIYDCGNLVFEKTFI